MKIIFELNCNVENKPYITVSYLDEEKNLIDMDSNPLLLDKVAKKAELFSLALNYSAMNYPRSVVSDFFVNSYYYDNKSKKIKISNYNKLYNTEINNVFKKGSTDRKRFVLGYYVDGKYNVDLESKLTLLNQVAFMPLYELAKVSSNKIVIYIGDSKLKLNDIKVNNKEFEQMIIYAEKKYLEKIEESKKPKIFKF